MSSPVPVEPAEAAAPPAPALAYHRLARARPRYRWWRMLLTGLVGIVLYVVMLLMILVPLALAAVFVPEIAQGAADLSTAEAFFDLDRLWLFLALVVPLILMIPALLLASRMIEGRGVGFLSSVAGRLRWGWICRTLLLALAVFAVYFAAAFAAAVLSGEEVAPRFDHPGIPLMILLVLLLIPFQAAAEEYVFRGYLMQLIGGWLRHPAFAILLPVPLFVLGHAYDLWGSISVGAFAIVAAWLTWRTGGLEAAISLHIVNNVLIFLLGSVSLVDANATESTPLDVAATIVTLVVYALIADRGAQRQGLARRAEPMPAPALAPSAGTL